MDEATGSQRKLGLREMMVQTLEIKVAASLFFLCVIHDPRSSFKQGPTDFFHCLQEGILRYCSSVRVYQHLHHVYCRTCTHTSKMKKKKISVPKKFILKFALHQIDLFLVKRNDEFASEKAFFADILTRSLFSDNL